MRDYIFDFSGVYPTEYDAKFEMCRIPCGSISGTDMYCDEDAQSRIAELMHSYAEQNIDQGEPFAVGGIHLIDGGNYHYMTRLLTSNLDRPYTLVVFDHHTDMKPAMFDLLSCGSWIGEVLDRDTNVVRIVVIGPPMESVSEIPERWRLDSRVCFVTAETLSKESAADTVAMITGALSESFPVYISVDRDILCEEDARTNWDQGEVTQTELERILRGILDARTLLGADICGALPHEEEAGFSEAQKINAAGDAALIELFREYMR